MPTSEAWTRDLAVLEAERRGWAWVDTTWTGYKRKTQPFPRTYDLFGCVDMMATMANQYGSGSWLYLIQFTSRPNHAARRKKMQKNRALRSFIDQGAVALVWSFSADGKLWEETIE